MILNGLDRVVLNHARSVIGHYRVMSWFKILLIFFIPLASPSIFWALFLVSSALWTVCSFPVPLQRPSSSGLWVRTLLVRENSNWRNLVSTKCWFSYFRRSGTSLALILHLQLTPVLHVWIRILKENKVCRIWHLLIKVKGL